MGSRVQLPLERLARGQAVHVMVPEQLTPSVSAAGWLKQPTSAMAQSHPEVWLPHHPDGIVTWEVLFWEDGGAGPSRKWRLDQGPPTVLPSPGRYGHTRLMLSFGFCPPMNFSLEVSQDGPLFFLL